MGAQTLAAKGHRHRNGHPWSRIQSDCLLNSLSILCVSSFLWH